MWTDKKIEKLKELWGKGSTASQIASIIGDVTRNAVIGKAYRLNLTSKSTPKKTNFKSVAHPQKNESNSERKTRRSGTKYWGSP